MTLATVAAVTVAVFTPSADAASAERSVVTVAFGNVVKATYPDGRVQRYWFDPDHTWRAIGRRGTASSGKWTVNGEQVCLKQSRPFPSPIRYCTTFPSNGAMGLVWSAKDAGGHPIKLSLLKGGR